MANAITITYGSTTLNLLDVTNYGVMEYVPLPGEGEGDGEIIETAKILVRGTDMATLQANLQALQTAMWYAARYNENRQGDAVYVNVQPNGAAASYRSQLLAGSVVTDDETLGVDVANLELEATVTWRRVGYWEGAETELGLSQAGATTYASGGKDVYKKDSATAGQYNHVEILGSDVGGNLPGAVKIQIVEGITQLATLVTGFTNVFIGHGVYADFSALVTQLGTAGALTWTETTEKTALTSATLTSANLDAAKGGWFRLLLNLTAAPSLTDLYLRARLVVKSGASTTVIWNGPLVFNNGKFIQDLGIVRIPPFLIGQTTLYPLTLELNALSATSGSKSLDFSHIEMRPVDGWRALEIFSGYYVNPGADAANPEVVLNEYDNLVYVNHDVSGGSETEGKFGTVTAVGKPILLVPGKTQRLYFSWLSDANYNMGYYPYATVQVWYRPRKLSL